MKKGINLYEKLEQGGSSDKLIKKIKKKFDSIGVSKILKKKKHHIKGTEIRKIKKKRALAKKHFYTKNT